MPRPPVSESPATSAYRSSASTCIVLNFTIVKGLPWSPMRVWRNKTGEPSTLRMAIAVAKRTGLRTSIPTMAPTMSTKRLITKSEGALVIADHGSNEETLELLLMCTWNEFFDRINRYADCLALVGGQTNDRFEITRRCLGKTSCHFVDHVLPEYGIYHPKAAENRTRN